MGYADTVVSRGNTRASLANFHRAGADRSAAVSEDHSFHCVPEGWALYTEWLAKQAGWYEKDPFGDLGRLQAELFRSVRLVVDTGIHAKRWTREQAIAYMREKTGMAEKEVTAEIERYIVNPGQACLQGGNVENSGTAGACGKGTRHEIRSARIP